MSVKVGELYASMALNKRPFDRSLEQTEQSARGWASRVGGTFAHAAGALLKWGAILGTVVAGGAYVAANAASDLAETVSKVGVVFGDLGPGMIAWAQDAATALGMSRNEALTAAGTYGNLFRSMGMTEGKSSDMSQSLVQLAADLASFNNQDPTEVMEKLRAGLVGEVMPLRSLGVNLNQALIEQRALELGLWDGKGALDASAKAQASYSLILEQTSLAQGDFERTSKGMANQQRILKAAFKDTVASVGAAIMPLIVAILPRLTRGLQRFGAWVTANMPAIQSTMEHALAGIGLAFDLAFKTVFRLIEGFQWLQTNVFPPLLEAFGDVRKQVGPGLGEAFRTFTKDVLPGVIGALTWLGEHVLTGLAAVVTWFVEDILPSLVDIFDTISTVWVPALQRAFEGFGTWVTDNWPTISSILGKIGDTIKAAFESAAAAIEIASPVLVAIGEVVLPAIGAAVTALLEIVNTNFPLIQAIAVTAFTMWALSAGTAAIATGVTLVASVGVLITKLGLFLAALNPITIALSLAVLAWVTDFLGVRSAITSMIDELLRFLGIKKSAGQGTFGGGGSNGPLGQGAGGGGSFALPVPGAPLIDWRANAARLQAKFAAGGFAAGTSNWPGGWGIVGERGPELVNLPSGSRVYPNGQGPGQGGLSVQIGSINVNGVGSDVSDATRRRYARDVVDDITAAIRDQAGQIVRVRPTIP